MKEPIKVTLETSHYRSCNDCIFYRSKSRECLFYKDVAKFEFCNVKRIVIEEYNDGRNTGDRKSITI